MTTGIGVTSFGLLRSSGGTFVGKPTLDSAVKSGTSTTLTLTAVDAADIIYARYRLSNGDGAWSLENPTFSRTGSGTIVITGLLADRAYEYAIYGKDFDITSEWGFLDNRRYDFTEDLSITIVEDDALSLSIEDLI